jgi:hypothetical protein
MAMNQHLWMAAGTIAGMLSGKLSSAMGLLPLTRAEKQAPIRRTRRHRFRSHAPPGPLKTGSRLSSARPTWNGSLEFYEQKVRLALSPATIPNHLVFEAGDARRSWCMGARRPTWPTTRKCGSGARTSPPMYAISSDAEWSSTWSSSASSRWSTTCSRRRSAAQASFEDPDGNTIAL